MSTFQLLLSIAIGFGGIWAEPTSQNDILIFSNNNNTQSSEMAIYKSLDKSKNVFGQKPMEYGVNIGVGLISAIPIFGMLGGFLLSIRDFLSIDSDPNSVLAKAIADALFENDLEKEIESLAKKFDQLNDDYKTTKKIELPLKNTQKDMAFIAVVEKMHDRFGEMIQSFSAGTSVFRKEPLIGAPIAIQLALAIASFTPIAKALLESVHDYELSCRMRDVLLDYQKRAVFARLEKLKVQTSFDIKFKKTFEWTPDYSIKENNITMRLDSSLEREFDLFSVVDLISRVMVISNKELGADDRTKSCKQHRKITNELNVKCIDSNPMCQKRDPFEWPSICLIDKYGPNERYIENYNDIKQVLEYPAFVKRRVEEMFPIDLLNSLCERNETKTPSGQGWLTLKIKKLCATGRYNHCKCSSLGAFCDLYLKVFINGNLIKQTSPTKRQCPDIDFTYITPHPISKDSKITIEVYHHQLFGADSFVMSVEEDVNTFLQSAVKRPYTGENWYCTYNFIETVSFWQDKFE